MLNFANTTLSEDQENTPDATGARPGSARDDGSEVTPLFTPGDGGSSGAPAEQDHQPAMSDKAVREQVQRVRLDLLARETERLNRRLSQILEQQQEDRQLRDRLQAEVGNLCQRVDQLIAGAGSGAGADGSGADLRTTVKPLLQAVLDMLDGPVRKAPGETAATRLPREAPPPRAAAPSRPDSASRAAEAATRSSPSADALPLSTVSGPAAGGAPRQQPSPAEAAPIRPSSGVPPKGPNRSAEEVEARAVALQRALSRLEQASRASAPARPPQPPSDPSAAAAPPSARPDPGGAPAGVPSGSAARPTPGGEPTTEERLSRTPAPTARPDMPPMPERPVPEPKPGDDIDNSMGAEDPAIEIARLLRPVDAKSQAKSPDQWPDGPSRRAVPPPAAQRPTQPELLLGTNETPEVGEPDRRPPPPAAKPGPSGGSGVRQRLMQSAVARRATGTIAQDRAAPKPSGPGRCGPDGSAVPPAGFADGEAESPSASPFSGSDAEPLPRCLTEPWDDLETGPGALRDGQDKGARRWPFRRGRSGGHAADHGKEGPSD